ncbi:hypothetical protein LXM50_14380 [Microbacterium sp. Au-Mic1]|uniref:hypothetical protein n=1 Tax=Microbacterium sp. Au-Mic1 TaxID=2906457 RepID=UPI001E5EADD3|nr:hypothetical protein [Microbacterium sp. Au-Mic1]MCE4027163.1 hypothetical protein [Microbacterium sp. Au-Mic1]
MTEHDSPTAPEGLTRRAALVAGAWSVPVIAAAVAAPLAAASTPLLDATALNGAGRAFDFDGVSPGDSIALIIQVSDNGTPYSGSASAVLAGASGIATWDGDLLDVGADPNSASAPVDGGELSLPIVVGALGSFSVTVLIASSTWTFSVTLS